MKNRVLFGTLATAVVLCAGAVAAAPASAAPASQVPALTNSRPLIPPGCDGDSLPPPGITTYIKTFFGNNACTQCDDYRFNYPSFPTYCWQTSPDGMSAQLWIGSHLGVRQ